MKYFEKTALSESDEGIVAYRAIREGNRLFASPEYQEIYKKQSKKVPAEQTKYQRQYALKGLGYGGATGAAIGAGLLIASKVKGIKNIAKTIGIGGVGGATLGGLVGLDVGGTRDLSDNLETIIRNAQTSEKKYLKEKGIKATYDRAGNPTYISSPKATKKYFTEYDRRVIRANR